MIMDGATNDLRQSGIVEGALNVGGKIPRFVLSDALGKEVNVEEIIAALTDLKWSTNQRGKCT
jgi:hypothetical protein